MSQRQLKGRQQRCMIDLIFSDDELGRLKPINRHLTAKSIDHPIFLDPGGQVFITFFNVIPTSVTFARGNEFHDDGWDVELRIGLLSQTGPDDSVGPTPVVSSTD